MLLSGVPRRVPWTDPMHITGLRGREAVNDGARYIFLPDKTETHTHTPHVHVVDRHQCRQAFTLHTSWRSAVPLYVDQIRRSPRPALPNFSPLAIV